ncbi:hypothetical protein DL96DRAFT_1812541 [Flagelloscypha sp. PMI_526]|nr:hypothetical protein DL96DRAFT_1812541 [Flagelloscypha sp. PMI_526]
MATIRIHKKSHTGCLTCRWRKVKCDETGHPNCQNCQKRQVACDWPIVMAGVGNSQHLSEQSPSSQSVHSRYSSGEGPPTHPTEPQHVFDIATLELFCHLTTEMPMTYVISDSSYAHIVHTYEHMVPQLAFTHPFLMHALLSLAALNLHGLSKDKLGQRDHYSLSEYHFRHAVASMATACQEGNCISIGHNCTQLVAAQFISRGILSVISLCNLSSPNMDHSTHSQLNAIIDWIEARRKLTAGFFRTHAHKLLNGPLSPYIKILTNYVTEARQNKTSHSSSSDLPGTPVFPELLSTIHIPSEGTPDGFELLEPGTPEAYREAVVALQFAYFLFSWESRSPAFDTWLGVVPPSYIELLRKQRPRALVILANFWALFHATLSRPRHTMWWEPSIAHGSGPQVDWVLKITEALPLEWKTYLDICLCWRHGNVVETE